MKGGQHEKWKEINCLFVALAAVVTALISPYVFGYTIGNRRTAT
jgi:ABC-type cobalt transport system substrate-binding protein